MPSVVNFTIQVYFFFFYKIYSLLVYTSGNRAYVFFSLDYFMIPPATYYIVDGSITFIRGAIDNQPISISI